MGNSTGDTYELTVIKSVGKSATHYQLEIDNVSVQESVLLSITQEQADELLHVIELPLKTIQR